MMMSTDSPAPPIRNCVCCCQAARAAATVVVAAIEIGTRIGDYLRLSFAKPAQTGPKTWTGTILKTDRFGNLITNFDSETWRRLMIEPFEMKVGARLVWWMASNYAEMPAGDLFVIAGSAGFLEVSLNRGSAAKEAGAASGDDLELRLL